MLLDLKLTCLLICIFVAFTQGYLWPKFLISHAGEDIRLVDVGDQVNYTVLVDRLVYCLSVDVDVEEKLVFYVNNKDEIAVLNVDKTDAKHTQLVDALPKNVLISHHSLSVDWVTKKLYWSESETNRIELMSYEKAPFYRKVIIYENLHGVRSLVVDPIHGYIFFFNHEDGLSIDRVWMDGTHRETLITIVEHGQLNVLTVDYKESKIYWSDAESISSASLDGTDRRLVVGNLRQPYGLTIFDNHLLWGYMWKNGVFACPKHFCGDKLSPIITDVKPFVLGIFDPAKQVPRFNPCAENNGGCSHLCLLVPVKPFYVCTCPTGIRLLSDNVTCSTGPSRIVLVARSFDLRVISLDTPDFTDSLLNVKRIKEAVAIDYDPIDGFVYWSDNELKEIRRVKLNGSDEQSVIDSELERCDGLAIDWIARNIYWTDLGTNRIEVSRLDGTARRVLVSTNISKPRAIVLDPSGGYMYWSDWDERSPKIEKAFLDGSNRTALIEFDKNVEHWPNGLALDVSNRKIYFADAKTDEIWRASSLDGSRRELIISRDLNHVFGFSILDDYMYWSDWQHRSLERAKIFNGSSRITIHDSLADLKGIKAVDLSSRPFGWNECAMKNGACSHLCLYRPPPYGKICACPVGFELSSDRRTCVVPEAFLIFTQQNAKDIFRISLSRSPANLDRLQLHNVTEPLAIDYNFNQKKIYFAGTDGNTGIISSAYLNGSHISTLITSGNLEMEGLAVDWCAENLYWSDSRSHHIEVSRLTGKSRRIIVWQNVQPRALVVHPGFGYLYWADWVVPPSVQRAELDGSDRTTLLSDVGRVMAMTLDYGASKIYLSASDSNTIYSADLNGEHRRVVLSEQNVAPYALTYFGDNLYFADWKTASIEVCNKVTGGNRTTLHSNLSSLMNLIAVHPLKQKGWNSCGMKKQFCDHLCFFSPSVAEKSRHDSARCSCPTHYTLDANGPRCKPPASFVLFSHKATIRRIKMKNVLDREDYPISILPIKTKVIKTLDYDPTYRWVLWMTQELNPKDERKADYILHRANDDESANNNEFQIKFATFDSAERIIKSSYDPYSRTMFWTNGLTLNATRIFADKTQIKHLGAVISSPEYHPNVLAVDNKRRSLYFANSDVGSSIVRCSLNGKHCLVVVASVIGQVDSLAVDPESGTLYWSELLPNKLGTINRIDFNGRNKKIIVSNRSSSVSMAIYRDRLYFVHVDSDLIESIDKSVGGDIRTESGLRFLELSRILAVDETISADILSNPCASSICSHLCLLNDEPERPYTCGCPIEMTLGNDNKTCVPLVTCRFDEWRCDNGLQCIDRYVFCDGHRDCPDGSDETQSKCRQCSRNQFQCSGDHKCISRKNYCDGTPHCTDKSDEACSCPEGSQFLDCKVPSVNSVPVYCLNKDIICNGLIDCANGIDEKACCDDDGPCDSKIYTSTLKPVVQSTTDQSGIVYYSLIVVGVIVFVVIGFFLAVGVKWTFCRNKPRTTELHVNLVNQQGSSVDGQTVTTTVLDVNFTSGSAEINPLAIRSSSAAANRSLSKSAGSSSAFSHRPDLTGKSSSSSDHAVNPYYESSSVAGSDGGVVVLSTAVKSKSAPHNPPPSPASSVMVVRDRGGAVERPRRRRSVNSSSTHRSTSAQRHRPRKQHSNRNRYGGQRVTYTHSRDISPPPPYSPCSTEVNRSDYEEPGPHDPLLAGTGSPVRNAAPPPSPVVDAAGRSGLVCGSSKNPKNSSTCAKHRRVYAPPPSPVTEKSFRTSTIRVHYNNPPPSPNESGGSSFSSS